jgi:ABC-type nitrate/sulfonate/bicarbonate transport system substrate-binding protein
MGGDNAFLRLVVQPSIRSYADLKGKTLSVDALTTGFAFVLREMLTLNGIAEQDVTFERAGGVLQRFEALKAGAHAGTLLITPFDLVAQMLGLRVLQSAPELFPHYQGVCGAARRSWAESNPALLIGFIRGRTKSVRSVSPAPREGADSVAGVGGGHVSRAGREAKRVRAIGAAEH